MLALSLGALLCGVVAAGATTGGVSRQDLALHCLATDPDHGMPSEQQVRPWWFLIWQRRSVRCVKLESR
jgi:hypothetical protein